MLRFPRTHALETMVLQKPEAEVTVSIDESLHYRICKFEALVTYRQLLDLAQR